MPSSRNPDNYERLVANLALNEADNVETFPMALGGAAGQAAMHVATRANWHSFAGRRESRTGQTLSVPMQTVDEFLRDKEGVTFIRMDVEGYEVEVLRGMVRTLENAALRRLFVEVHGDMLEPDDLREGLDMLRAARFEPELIVHNDRPGLIKVLAAEHLETIYKGDGGTYEVFFHRASP